MISPTESIMDKVYTDLKSAVHEVVHMHLHELGAPDAATKSLLHSSVVHCINLMKEAIMTVAPREAQNMGISSHAGHNQHTSY